MIQIMDMSTVSNENEKYSLLSLTKWNKKVNKSINITN